MTGARDTITDHATDAHARRAAVAVLWATGGDPPEAMALSGLLVDASPSGSATRPTASGDLCRLDVRARWYFATSPSSATFGPTGATVG
nr:hypothetical protein [Streptomyces hygroscopicus]